MPKLPYEPCIKLMLEKSGGKMTKEEAREALDHFNGFLKNKKAAAGDVNLADALRQEAKNYVEKKKIAAQQDYVHSILNAQKQKERLGAAAPYKNLPGQSLWDGLVGGARAILGSKDSVDYNRKAIFQTVGSRLFKRLNDADAWPMLTSHKFDQLIMRELQDIGLEKRPPVTGEMKKVREIADAIHEAQGTLVARANRAGAFVKQIPGYLVKQTHNVPKMKKIGFDGWKKRMIDRLDEKTYEGADPEKFLKSAWDAITSGVRKDSEAPGYGGGTQNLAKKMSEERVFHFKNSDAAFQHLQEFGQGTVSDAMFSGLQQMSNSIAMLEKWGPNPEHNFNAVRERLKEQYRTDEKALKSLKDKKLDYAWNVVSGMPTVDGGLANVGRGLRLIQFFAKLGFASKYGITVDPATGWLQMALEGKPFIQAVYEGIQSRAKALVKGGDQKEIFANTLSHFEGMVAASNKFAPGEDFTGIAAKSMMLFTKMTGMHPLDMMNRAGFEGELTRYLAQDASKSFGDLSAVRQKRLGEFSINEADWELLRKAVYKSETGNSYMQVQMIRDRIKPEAIAADLENAGKKVTDDAIQRRYDELETKLGTYVTDATDRALFRGGAAEQVLLGYGIAEKGTGVGEAVRVGGQFKSYPLAAWRKGLLPHAYEAGTYGVARFIATTTLLGYATIALEDLVRGTDPSQRDFTDPQLAFQAAAKGGGLGIYGDFLFGQSELWEGIAGPTFGPALTVGTALRDSLQEGDPTKFKDQLMSTGRGNIPLQNLWYTKSALDYLIAFQMQEWMNPGFLQRMEARRKDRGQPEFFIPPSRVIPYGGGEYPGQGAVGAAQEVTGQ